VRPDGGEAAPLTTELPLLPFTCVKQIPSGIVRFSFRASSPTDVTFRIAFDGPCPYQGEATLVAGRAREQLESNTYRCRRSLWSPLAVGCGYYGGVDLDVFVRGNGWGRTVRVRFPVPPPEGIKDATDCKLPFVEYDEQHHARYIRNEDLVFDLAQCKVQGQRPHTPSTPPC
jgi:hypothetical protein